MTNQDTDPPDEDGPPVRLAFPAGDGPLAAVALITLDRPDALNALSFALIAELGTLLAVLDGDPACRAIVLTGAGERAFAAGADIRELAGESPRSLHEADPFAPINGIGHLRTPVIAAVRGFALGGGCELAMACDMVVAGDDVQFGQPEIRLGVIPGAGGTQRLTRAIGKARAMELILTGRRIRAHEAEAMGLVSFVVPAAGSPPCRRSPWRRRRRRSWPPRGSRWPRASTSSGSGSRPCSTPTTSARGWSRSWRSAARPGRAARFRPRAARAGGRCATLAGHRAPTIRV
jgi:enoyl-CoA hydratase/carnithine racemase